MIVQLDLTTSKDKYFLRPWKLRDSVLIHDGFGLGAPKPPMPVSLGPPNVVLFIIVKMEFEDFMI